MALREDSEWLKAMLKLQDFWHFIRFVVQFLVSNSFDFLFEWYCIKHWSLSADHVFLYVFDLEKSLCFSANRKPASNAKMKLVPWVHEINLSNFLYVMVMYSYKKMSQLL